MRALLIHPAVMHRFLLATVACAALIASAPAIAAAGAPMRTHPWPARVLRAAVTSRDPIGTATRIAERFWHAIPCGGHIAILAAQPLAAGLGPSTDGWVTFDSSLGADDLAAPASTYTRCTLTLARWQWATWTAMEGGWGMFCLTVVHEMGHLLGHPHSDRRGSVMNPVFTSDGDVPRVCNAAWLAGWRDAGSI